MMRKAGAKLRRQVLAVDRVASYAEVALRLIRDDPVIVFSMGKAGTTALEVALDESGIPTVKAHALTRDGIAARFENALVAEPARRPRFLWGTQVVRWDLAVRPRHPRRFVAAVREPVARAVSAHFYRLAMNSSEISLDPAAHEADVIRLVRKFAFDEDWFVDEFLPVTGIDVRRQPFDHGAGYTAYEVGAVRAVVVRQEDLARCGVAALNWLVGTASGPLQQSNTASDSGAAEASAHFRSTYRFDDALLAEVYDHPTQQRFYTADERTRFRARWTAPSQVD